MCLPASRQSTAPSAESFGPRCGRLLARQIAVNGSCEQGPGAQATPSLKCTCTRRPALSTSADTQIKPSKGLVQPHLRVTRAWTAVRRCPKMVFWCSKTLDEHNVDSASISVCPMRPRRTMPELSAAAATCQVTARWLESRHVAHAWLAARDAQTPKSSSACCVMPDICAQFTLTVQVTCPSGRARTHCWDRLSNTRTFFCATSVG